MALASRSAQPGGGARRSVMRASSSAEAGSSGASCSAFQRQAQREQLARAHLAQRDARGDAFHVAGVLQLLAQRAPGRGRAAEHRGLQRADGLEPRLRLGAVAARRQQPALQQPAAHARHAGVEQREHGGRLFAAQRLHQLEVAPRGGRQLDQVAVALDRQALHVRERAALRVLGVAQQGRGRGMRVGEPSAFHAARLLLPSCSLSLRSPRPPSNCQAGRIDSVNGVAPRAAFRRCSKAGVTSALYSSSLGAMRAIQVSSASAGHSASAARRRSR
jgi:hypothetical protein